LPTVCDQLVRLERLDHPTASAGLFGALNERRLPFGPSA